MVGAGLDYVLAMNIEQQIYEEAIEEEVG